MVFPHETKLGMLLERFDERDDETNSKRERTLVKMVIEGGAAETRGVKVGSKVVSINGKSVMDRPYMETLHMVKNEPRPLAVKLEHVGSFTDASQGECLIRKDYGKAAPAHLHLWESKYFVIGGAVAKPNVLQVRRPVVLVSLSGSVLGAAKEAPPGSFFVFGAGGTLLFVFVLFVLPRLFLTVIPFVVSFASQLYNSKRDYEEVVVRMFQNAEIDHIQFKAYKLSLSFRCGPCQTKSYNQRGLFVERTFFWLKNPASKTKVLKISSENSSTVTGLRIQVAKHTSQG